MMDAMKKAGCEVDEKYFRCLPCTNENISGGFNIDTDDTSV